MSDNVHYLFVVFVIWSKKSIALAVNSRRGTSTNCVHFPMCVVIVHHMEVAMSTPANIKHLRVGPFESEV